MSACKYLNQDSDQTIVSDHVLIIYQYIHILNNSDIICVDAADTPDGVGVHDVGLMHWMREHGKGEEKWAGELWCIES